MVATVNFLADTFTQSAINSIALEQAASAASAALKGEAPNAWSAASAIANACALQAFAPSSKAIIFGIAAKQASEAFAAARLAAGALKADSSWSAFASACSTAKNALEYGVWVADIGKSEAAKGIKGAREALETASYQMAVDAGLVPAQSTPATELAAMRKELFSMNEQLNSQSGALKAAQDRLVPIDTVTAAHDKAVAELRAELAASLIANGELRAELAELAAKATKAKAIKAKA